MNTTEQTEAGSNSELLTEVQANESQETHESGNDGFFAENKGAEHASETRDSEVAVENSEADSGNDNGNQLPEYGVYGKDIFGSLEEGSDDAEVFELVRAKCHEAGITEAQLQTVIPELYKKLDELNDRYNQASSESVTKELNGLKQKYGAKYDSMVETANNTLRNLCTQFGVDHKAFMHPSVANNANVVEFFYHLGQRDSENGIKGTTEMHAIATAKSELESILNGSHALSKAYFNVNDPEWAKANERVNYLMRIQ